jgi:integrase
MLYKRKTSPFFWYEFEIDNRRFSRSTRTATRNEAERIEREARSRAIAELALERAGGPKPDAPLTINLAAQKYWEQHGSHLVRPDQVEKALAWLVETLGPDTPIRDISNPEVADLVAKRRGAGVVNVSAAKGRAADAKRRKRRERAPVKLVSPATVNRSAVEPLRKLLNYCRDVLEEPVRPIKWKLHLRAEPSERIRTMKAGEEEAALLAALPAKYHPLVKIKARIGPRIFEMVKLKWTDINWGLMHIEIMGKGGDVSTVPIPTDVRDILWALSRQGDYVFTHEDGSKFTYDGVQSAWKRACRKAGIVGLRIHDLRHTAGTNLLAATGNLRLAQRLLRHKDIRSTLRYAHVLDEDLRSGLESTQKTPTVNPDTGVKSLKKQA